jgi:uncharacterized membrane protein YadS
MNFNHVMEQKHMLATRVAHLRKTIDHCASVIALCEIGGQVNAKAAYEARLKELVAELKELVAQQEEVP